MFFTVNFEQFSHLSHCFFFSRISIVNFEQVTASWVNMFNANYTYPHDSLQSHFVHNGEHINKTSGSICWAMYPKEQE